MPDHAPTRRTRRLGTATSPIDPGPGHGSWRPAERSSRLPAWVPGPIRTALRIGFRISVVCFCTGLALALFYLIASSRFNLSEIQRMPERSVVFALQGQELGTLHGASRRLISRDEIPPFLVRALRAREDKRFYEHGGVDYLGLIRATLRNLKDRSFTQGASTLTMQLARNSFDMRAKSLHRKFLEVALAIRIEWEFTKDEILTAYLNRIYFGSGCHGLDEAARRYFGVSSSELTPNQSALLVGIIRGPHAFSPLRNLPGAERQRDEVLARMVSEKFITPHESDHIRSSDLGVRAASDLHRGGAGLQAARRHIEELLAASEIRQGGLHFYSTIHAELQPVFESELRDLRTSLGGEIEVAGLCINNRTGGIRAIVGGRTSSGKFNRALDARRDLGGILLPFLYAAAAERGVSPHLEEPLRTGREIGPDYLAKIARRIGISGPFGQGDDLYRGSISATPVEVATATATLASGGRRPRPFFLREIRDPQDRLLLEIPPSFTPVLERSSAAAALAMQFPDGEPRLLVALSPGKTDLWAISCGTRHTICLWAGADRPQRFPDPALALRLGHSTVERLARSLSP